MSNLSWDRSYLWASDFSFGLDSGYYAKHSGNCAPQLTYFQLFYQDKQ